MGEMSSRSPSRTPSEGDRSMTGQGSRSPARDEDDTAMGEAKGSAEEETLELLTAKEKELLWTEVLCMEELLKVTEARVEGMAKREQVLTQHEDRLKREEAKEERMEKKIQNETAPAEEGRQQGARDRRDGPRRLGRAGAGSAMPGGRRMLQGMLGLLSKEKDRLTSTTSQTAKKLERQRDLERKVREKDHKRAAETTAQQRETLQSEKKTALELIVTLRDKIAAARADWSAVLKHEQAAGQAQHLKVAPDGAPAIFWTPAKHTAGTAAQLRAAQAAVAAEYRAFRAGFDPRLAAIKKDGYIAQQRRAVGSEARAAPGRAPSDGHSDTERVVFN